MRPTPVVSTLATGQLVFSRTARAFGGPIIKQSPCLAGGWHFWQLRCQPHAANIFVFLETFGPLGLTPCRPLAALPPSKLHCNSCQFPSRPREREYRHFR